MKKKVTYEYLDYVPKKQRAMSMKESEGYSKVNVGIQTIIPPRHYIPPVIAASHRLSLLDFPRVLYMPHTIFFLLVGLTIFISIGLRYTDYEPDFSVSMRRGLMAAAALLLFYSAFYLPDTLLNRPHPILWRVAQGACCIYLIYIVFILFMDLGTARELLRYLDPGLTNLPYPINECNLDFFKAHLVAQTIGWWFKMLIFRDAVLCAVLSLINAGIESSFRFCMSSQACWTEIIIFDYGISSAIGIFIGYFTCKYLELHTHKWFGKQQPTNPSALAKVVEIFHPNVWWNYTWNPFGNANRFLGVTWLLLVTQASDLNIFFLRVLLKLPPSHWLLIIRALFLAFTAMISIKEYYEYINSK